MVCKMTCRWSFAEWVYFLLLLNMVKSFLYYKFYSLNLLFFAIFMHFLNILLSTQFHLFYLFSNNYFLEMNLSLLYCYFWSFAFFFLNNFVNFDFYQFHLLFNLIKFDYFLWDYFHHNVYWFIFKKFNHLAFVS